MIAHIAKRSGLAMLGYVAAMVVIAIPVWRVSLITGPTTYYWTKEGVFVGPEYTGLVLALADILVSPFLPALIMILAAEIFRWRFIWAYLIGWTLVFAVATFSGSLPLSPEATMVANLSASLGGLIYWVIAGRHAGRPIEIAIS